MSNSTKQSRGILLSGLLMLATAVALNSPQTLAETAKTQSASSNATGRPEFKSYGPPSKGFYYYVKPHGKQSAAKVCSAQSQEYGPPSTRMRNLNQNAACRSMTRAQSGIVK